jgi:hypothetical protein
MARSLVDGLGLESVGRAKGGRARRRVRGERVKAGLALSMLVVACGILSWHFGFLPESGRAAGRPASPGDIEELKRQQDANKLLITRDGGRQGDS